MNYLDLFSGIGGFALGAYWADMKFKNHYCSDIEPFCVDLYKKRFPDSIQLGDITKINCDDLPKGEWIITGGFPCQDISIAGKGKGLIDDEGNKTRSGLWFTYADIIDELRPKFAIMENVGALTHRGLDAVLGSLSEIGYNAEWQDIRAEDVGAPHRRERIWIIAYPSSIGGWGIQGQKRTPETVRIKSSGGKQFIPEADEIPDTSSIRRNARGNIKRKHENNISEIREATENKQSGSIRECGSKSICATGKISDIKSGEPRKLAKQEGRENISRRGEKISHPQSLSCDDKNENKQRSQTIPKKRFIGNRRGWTVEPTVRYVDDGLSDKLDRYQGRLTNKSYKRIDRLKGLGNSIVPQIAELLFKQIKSLI